jgi:hypothetical protein
MLISNILLSLPISKACFEAYYRKSLRCYCGLMRSLPEDANASPTYYLCSRAFVQWHWEVIPKRPVNVELGGSGIEKL